MIRDFVKLYRKLPFEPLKKPLSSLLRKYQLKNKNRIVVSEVDGITYELDLNELIESSIYYQGCFEAATTAIINKYVKNSMIVFDIGANIGCHALRSAKLVGSEGKVFAFEPMSRAFVKISKNIKLNNLKNIVLENKALSDKNLGKQEVHFQANYLLETGEEDKTKVKKELVEITTLDEYVKANKINKIDFIKLDVDGYEYKVLRGGIDSVKKFKPIMIIEFGKHTLEECGDKLGDLIGLIGFLGYSFYSEKKEERYNNKEAIINAIPEGRTINVLCIPGKD